MTTRRPYSALSLFISHGSPAIISEQTPTHLFLKKLGSSLPEPKAIILISAHWTTSDIKVNSNENPEQIFDFYGFDKSLYQHTYSLKGNPLLAEKISSLLQAKDLTTTTSKTAGIDHGGWIPLMLMYPKAHIPVVQVSLPTSYSPQKLYTLGQLLRPLRQEDIMILCSGNITHNLYEVLPNKKNIQPPHWVSDFSDWAYQNIMTNNLRSLYQYSLHPHAYKNHPTPEHILPLFIALGAGDKKAHRLHHGYEMGVLNMDTYQL